MNEIKKMQQSLSVARLIRALGRDEALKLLNEVDVKAPLRNGRKYIDNSPLSKKELENFKECLKKDRWIDMEKLLEVSKSNAAYNFARVAYRYLYNLKK